MKKLIIALSTFLTANYMPTIYPSLMTNDQQEIPAYAKWGQLAIKETQLKYPNARIVDYLHEGSETTANSTIERFKLWLKDGSNEFGVFIKIEYTTATEKVVNIEFHSTSGK